MLVFGISCISDEWKHRIKAREIVSKDFHVWIGRKSKNSRDFKSVNIIDI